MIGRKLSRYTIVEKIGEGGMGEVYRAEDSRLKRHVALKVLPESVANDPERLARFQREAESLAALDPSNIVTIYSVEEADGVRFLTMALIEGETLSSLIPATGLPLDKFFEIAEPIADALAAAHDAGITHRDIKPSNIMVSDDGRVRVLDFGLAKAGPEGPRGVAPQELPTVTALGRVLGTVPYMSPEQVEGRPLDHRSDLFSLGVLLYEMAVGQRPFAGTSQAALQSAILRDPPPPPDTVRPELPRQLGRILGQCLEKDPRKRVQTARDVQNQLRSLRREIELGDSATRASSAEAVPLAASTRRHAMRWLAPAAVALVVGVVAWQLSRGRPAGDQTLIDQLGAASPAPKMIAVMPFSNLGHSDDEYFAAGITEEITNRLAGVIGLSVRARTTVVAYDREGKSLPAIGDDLGVEYILEGTVRWSHDQDSTSSRVLISPRLTRLADATVLWGESYNRVLEDIFAIQSEISGHVLEQLGVTLLDADRVSSMNRETDNLLALEQFMRGSEYLLRATELSTANEAEIARQFFERAIELDPDFALAHAKLSRVHSHLYERFFDRTEERLKLARESAQTALTLAPDLPEGHVAMGKYFYDRLDYDEALWEFGLARRGRPGDSETVLAIAEVYEHDGRLAEALEQYLIAIELDPSRSQLHCQAGGVHAAAGEYAEAARRHEIAIAMRPERSCMYYCLTFVHLASDGAAKAREFLEAMPNTFGLEQNPSVAYGLYFVDLIEGRYNTALARLDKAPYEALEYTGSFYYPNDLARAAIYSLQGEHALAQESYRKALQLLDAKIALRPSDARLHGARGIALAGLGRREDAIVAGHRAVELERPDRNLLDGPYRLLELAEIHVKLGEHAAALDDLELIFSRPTWLLSVKQLHIDPRFAPLRGQPRFDSLQPSHMGSTSG